MNSNFAGGWTAVPSLPAPRANAVVVSLSGTPYVIGGRGASGAPTTTVFRGLVKEGALTGSERLRELLLDWYQTGPVPVESCGGLAARVARVLAVAG
jgi:hypothetical protein